MGRALLLAFGALLAASCGRKDTAKCHKACEDAHAQLTAACGESPTSSQPPKAEEIDAAFVHLKCESKAFEALATCAQACDK
jgi:hypothetical protein